MTDIADMLCFRVFSQKLLLLISKVQIPCFIGPEHEVFLRVGTVHYFSVCWPQSGGGRRSSFWCLFLYLTMIKGVCWGPAALSCAGLESSCAFSKCMASSAAIAHRFFSYLPGFLILLFPLQVFKVLFVSLFYHFYRICTLSHLCLNKIG